jgi:hypothetical protein
MSVKRPKAEVARRRWHFRYVPKAEVAMPVEEPTTVSQADIGVTLGQLARFPATGILV